MHFTKILTSFVLSAALKSVVKSFPVDTKLVRPDDNLGINADSEDWTHYANFCSGGAAKRSLEARAPQTPPMHDVVAQGKSKSYVNIPLGLFTSGLVTCIGVGIIGKTDDGDKPVRILAHFQTAEFTLGPEWDAFNKLIHDAKMDKDTTSGFMSVPNLDNNTPDGWRDSYKELGEKIYKELYSKVEGSVKGNPLVITRAMKPAIGGASDTAGTMSIDGQQGVFIEGTKRN